MKFKLTDNFVSFHTSGCQFLLPSYISFDFGHFLFRSPFVTACAIYIYVHLFLWRIINYFRSSYTFIYLCYGIQDTHLRYCLCKCNPSLSLIADFFSWTTFLIYSKSVCILLVSTMPSEETITVVDCIRWLRFYLRYNSTFPDDSCWDDQGYQTQTKD